MLSNLINIRRNGKPKGSLSVTKSSYHEKALPVPFEPALLSPIVFEINDEARAHRSTHLEVPGLLGSDEEWFPPHELFQSMDSALGSSLRNTKSATVTRNNSKHQTRVNSLCPPSRSHSASPAVTTTRKKSIPTPIVIPEAAHLMPKVRIGRSDVLSGNAGDAPPNPPSPPLSDSLSSVSGSTLARALIASSFVLSSGERSSSQHRSGVARQDSATLPRGSFFLPDSRGPSPVPVPAVSAAVSPNTDGMKSGASTDAECLTSGFAFTVANSSEISRRISCIQEVPSPATPISAASAIPDVIPPRKFGPVPIRQRAETGAVFDGPKTALEVPEQHLQEESLFLISEERSLDEFDFVAPEPVTVFSPDSDSSASYIAPIAPPSKRSHVLGKRMVGGRNSVQNFPTSTYLADRTPSTATSEDDYGELLNFDLTVSDGGTPSPYNLSSASTGYQTFPETPNMFTPLWSPGHALLAKADSQRPRRRLSSLTEARRRPVKLHGNLRSMRRQTIKSRGVGSLRASSAYNPTTPLSNLPLSAQVIDDVDEENQSVTLSQGESRHSVGLPSAARPHPLVCISSSSSLLLEEEALQAFTRTSSSLLPINIGDIDPLSEPATVSISVAGSSTEPPASIPLPESRGVSSLNSPASRDGPTVGSSKPPSSPQPASLTESSLPPSFLRRLSPVSAKSLSPSFVPPPPYHTVISERRVHHSGSNDSQQSSSCIRTRMKTRPPLPIGPRMPCAPGRATPPPIRSCAASHEGDTGPACSSGSAWRKFRSAASKPPPKFQKPPPKWRGLTLEAAQWSFTSAQLQEIVSQAVQQSFDGSSLRFMRPDVLEGEIADERHRLELQHTDVKAQYRALVRRRCALMGELASNVKDMNDPTAAARTMGELAEVLSALDSLADKMHEIALQMAQLKSLCDVHNTSALAMAVRKINGLLVRQMAEKDRLLEQVDALQTERDEAWKHAEGLAQDFDALLNLAPENGCATADAKVYADGQTLPNGRRSESRRLSAVRKSNVRQSQAALRPRSRSRSIYRKGRPTSLVLDTVPPLVPRLPLGASPGSSLLTGTSSTAGSRTSAGLALAEAQREVYEMLGLRLSLCLSLSPPPSSYASSSRRTTRSSADMTSAHVPVFRTSSLDVRPRRGA